MSNRVQTALLTSALAGLLVGCGGAAEAPPAEEKPAEAATDGHAEKTEDAAHAKAEGAEGEQAAEPAAHGCKGKNECKGQGGCAVEGQNECKGKNPCKDKGGCNMG